MVPAKSLADVARRELEQLPVGTEDNNSDIDLAKHRELMGLLKQAAFALQKRTIGSVSQERLCEMNSKLTLSDSGRP